MMQFFRFVTPALCCLTLCAGELFRDDFSRYPPRVFAQPVKELTNAIHEYHYLEHRGVPLAPWANAMIHDDAWAGGDEQIRGRSLLTRHMAGSEPCGTEPGRRPPHPSISTCMAAVLSSG